MTSAWQSECSSVSEVVGLSLGMSFHDLYAQGQPELPDGFFSGTE